MYSATSGRDDGLGWWLNLIGTLMRDFHHTYDQALACPVNRAFALMAFHAETHPFAAMERASDGYIAQEVSHRKNGGAA